VRRCFFCLLKDAASGVDGMTFQEYEKNLEANLDDLVGRLKRKAYRARLVRRKYIPKGPGKFRPLGIPVLKDKLLQVAATQNPTSHIRSGFSAVQLFPISVFSFAASWSVVSSQWS